MASTLMISCIIVSLFNLVLSNVPVLLWESSASEKVNSFPALHRLRSEDFQQYLLKKVHGEQPVPLIAVFVEKSLSMEDFSWQDSQGQSYFPQLKYITDNSANIEFLPSVQDPIQATKHLSEFGYTIQGIDSDENLDQPDICGKVLFVKLPEAKADEDRPELLRRHDVKISEVYSQLLARCSHVIGVLSGEQSSWVEPEEITRVRRAANDPNVTVVSGNSSKPNLFQLPIALVHSKAGPKLSIGENPTDLGGYSSNVVTGDNAKPTDIKLFVKYANDYRLTFNFDNKTSGYWYLRSIDVQKEQEPEIVLIPNQEIAAPLAKSYHSGQPVVFSNKSAGAVLTFSDFQAQPFFLNPGARRFSAAVDDVYFFTAAIWSGLFVTFLLLLIFTWGLSMIMDIRTMDQFDDPKGKTITVTATD